MADQIIVETGDTTSVIVEAEVAYNVEIVVTTGGDADNRWEDDTSTTIKPRDSKTVDGAYISGELFGGLFQP